MKNTNKQLIRPILGLGVMGALLVGVLTASGDRNGVPQASLTLMNSDAAYCYTHNNLWTLEKSAAPASITDEGTVTWTVTAVKSDGGTTFTVHGGMTVQNTGSGPAPLGNIVVNLQKPNAYKLNGKLVSWVSLAADIADATQGNAAFQARIVAAGSAESQSHNSAFGCGNYTVSGAQGTFLETAGSGALEFTDVANNTAFSMVPQPVIQPGQAITLLYHAQFQTAILPPPGTPLRVEMLVSFGNSGQRGGSGASAQWIDINGSTLLEADESHVRTVPARVTLPALTPPAECNPMVTVTDPGLAAVGDVAVLNTAGLDQFPANISATTSWTMTALVKATGLAGGQICNTANLNGTVPCSASLNIIVGYDLNQPIHDELGNVIGYAPIYAAYQCAPPAQASASACVAVTDPPSTDCPGCVSDDCTQRECIDGVCHESPRVCDGRHCSFSQGGFSGSGLPHNLLAANFTSLFPQGVGVGVPGDSGFSMVFTSADAIGGPQPSGRNGGLPNYLPAGGTAAALNSDLLNPTSSSAGVFGGQVLALKLNIALSDPGLTAGGLGNLYYCKPGDSLSGLTVRQILLVAEAALGGRELPEGYTYATLSGLCEQLDVSFDGKSVAYPACGVASAWAHQYLSVLPCR